VNCSETPTRPDDVVSDERTFYDGSGFGTAPTRGLPTRSERLASYSNGAPEYQTVVEKTFDLYGRELTTTDTHGNTTTTAYSSAVDGGAANTVTTTNPLGHTTVEKKDVRSQTVEEIDANNNATHLQYDPLGRLT